MVLNAIIMNTGSSVSSLFSSLFSIDFSFPLNVFDEPHPKSIGEDLERWNDEQAHKAFLRRYSPERRRFREAHELLEKLWWEREVEPIKELKNNKTNTENNNSNSNPIKSQ